MSQLKIVLGVNCFREGVTEKVAVEMEIAVLVGFSQKFQSSKKGRKNDLGKGIMVGEFGISSGNIKLFVLNLVWKSER